MNTQPTLFPDPDLTPAAAAAAPARREHHPQEYKVISLREIATPGTLGDRPELLVDYWRQAVPSAPWFDPMKETFVIILVNTRMRIIGHNFVAIGTLDTIFVHAREVFRPAIVAAAHSLVLTHNHPSGDPGPSEADIRCTRDLVRAGELLKIPVLDHLIIGSPSPERAKPYSSLRELGYFYQSP